MPEQILAGKYVVQNEIAKGGMGILYKALDRTLNRVVAIKMVHAHLSGDSSFVERFLREARAMARLQHDNIVTIYAVEEDQGTQLLVMEYFQGSNLRMLTRNQPRLPLRDIVSITHQLANALAFAHAHGIIHRDIKPANIMVDKRGKTKLTDFGIAAALDEASITSTGQVIGTPEYMSPEQARGTTLDGRSDLYSVGIILYELLTGKTPYAEASKTSILGKLAFDQQELSLPFPSDVPSMLQGVVRDLLRRQPDERIPDADTLVTQLHEILFTLPASAAAPTSSESDATVVVSPSPAANAPDKAESDLPTVLDSGGRSTRVSPPTATPRSPAPSHWEETTVLPPQPHKLDSSIKPPPSATPAPAPSPSPTTSSLVRPKPLIAGGLIIVALLVGLIYFLAKGTDDRPPDPPKPPTKEDQLPPTGESKDTLLEKRLKDREEIMSKLEELVHGTAKRVPEERQTSQCPALKALLAETYGKLEGAVREVNLVRQELRREPLSEPSHPSELDLPCEPPKPSPQARPKKPAPPPPAPPPPQPPVPVPQLFLDAELSSLLEKFKMAYERRNFDMLRTMSGFKEGRERNIEFMFSNYTSFKASIQNIKLTNDGATAQLVLDKAMSATGETISLSPLSRTFNLQISRQGDAWDKVIW